MSERNDPIEQSQDVLDQDVANAAKRVVQGDKPPKTDAEIADQVGRMTWKLADRVEKLAPKEQSFSDKPSVAKRNAQLPDGGKLDAKLALGYRGVTYSNVEGDDVHTAGAMWKHGRDDRHTDAGTESRGKGYSYMNTVDESGLIQKPKIRMDISDDPRPWKEKFEPATEEVRSQAISNAAGTLGKIRGAVAAAEIAKQSEKPQPGPEEPQPPVQDAA